MKYKNKQKSSVTFFTVVSLLRDECFYCVQKIKKYIDDNGLLDYIFFRNSSFNFVPFSCFFSILMFSFSSYILGGLAGGDAEYFKVL